MTEFSSARSPPLAKEAPACIAYTIDGGYLFPTLLSALQARGSVAEDTCDIAICHIGAASAASEAVHSICESSGILFRQTAPSDIGNMHVMYARLFLDCILERSYGRILYVDGDTQISGSLRELVSAELSSGMILAAPDPMTIGIRADTREGRRHSAYLESIGLPRSEVGDYFNSGVLCFNAKDLSEIRSACLAEHSRSKRAFRFPDQDLLNLAARGRRQQMSFKWNFPIYFLNHSGVEDDVAPRIYHFMSNPRPWHGAFAPWGAIPFERYAQLIHRYPQLAKLQPQLPAWLRAKYALQQYYKLASENLSALPGDFRRRIALIEKDAAV